ncbi:MAG: transketolase [Rhodospirillales bacterium]|nr:transketolase [Rhodospirillales bacterium]
MAVTNAPVDPAPIGFLEEKAHRLRRHMVKMASGKGQGYLGQGLDIADLLAALYFYEMRYDPADPKWPERDRFLLSTGHYSIGLWAALVECGTLRTDELSTYGGDGSRLDMSTLDSTPGVEMTGGSLAQGLGQAVGVALAHKLDKRDAKVFVELSDGELQEGSTWEAAMAGRQFKLDKLVAFIDCNGIQADGKLVLDVEPVADKWRAFGWDTMEIDGNRMAEVVAALQWARVERGVPKAVVMRTVPGKGIPTLEKREKAHFVRVGDDEWGAIADELEKTRG